MQAQAGRRTTRGLLSPVKLGQSAQIGTNRFRTKKGECIL